jgi:hypothetical protein
MENTAVIFSKDWAIAFAVFTMMGKNNCVQIS